MDNLDILHELSNMDLLTSLHEDDDGKDFIQNRTSYLCIHHYSLTVFYLHLHILGNIPALMFLWEYFS